jgi:hypothetical protein
LRDFWTPYVWYKHLIQSIRYATISESKKSRKKNGPKNGVFGHPSWYPTGDLAQGDAENLYWFTGFTEADIQQVQARVRPRVLRWFARQGYLDRDDAKEMGQWKNGGGFSLDASVRIEGHDRAGLERLLRYCARLSFVLERLENLDEQRLLYQLPKPRPDGCTVLSLTHSEYTR